MFHLVRSMLWIKMIDQQWYQYQFRMNAGFKQVNSVNFRFLDGDLLEEIFCKFCESSEGEIFLQQKKSFVRFFLHKKNREKTEKKNFPFFPSTTITTQERVWQTETGFDSKAFLALRRYPKQYSLPIHRPSMLFSVQATSTLDSRGNP